jgi:hypothetical protein
MAAGRRAVVDGSLGFQIRFLAMAAVAPSLNDHVTQSAKEMTR